LGSGARTDRRGTGSSKRDRPEDQLMPGRRQLLGASKPPTGTMMYGAAGSTTPLGSGFLATGFLVITAPLGQSHKTLGPLPGGLKRMRLRVPVILKGAGVRAAHNARASKAKA
jgi:hypothetical protein